MDPSALQNALNNPTAVLVSGSKPASQRPALRKAGRMQQIGAAILLGVASLGALGGGMPAHASDTAPVDNQEVAELVVEQEADVAPVWDQAFTVQSLLREARMEQEISQDTCAKAGFLSSLGERPAQQLESITQSQACTDYYLREGLVVEHAAAPKADEYAQEYAQQDAARDARIKQIKQEREQDEQQLARDLKQIREDADAHFRKEITFDLGMMGVAGLGLGGLVFSQALEERRKAKREAQGQAPEVELGELQPAQVVKSPGRRSPGMGIT